MEDQYLALYSTLKEYIHKNASIKPNIVNLFLSTFQEQWMALFLQVRSRAISITDLIYKKVEPTVANFKVTVIRSLPNGSFYPYREGMAKGFAKYVVKAHYIDINELNHYKYVYTLRPLLYEVIVGCLTKFRDTKFRNKKEEKKLYAQYAYTLMQKYLGILRADNDDIVLVKGRGPSDYTLRALSGMVHAYCCNALLKSPLDKMDDYEDEYKYAINLLKKKKGWN